MTTPQDIQDAIINRVLENLVKDTVIYTMPDGKTIACTGESITGGKE